MSSEYLLVCVVVSVITSLAAVYNMRVVKRRAREEEQARTLECALRDSGALPPRDTRENEKWPQHWVERAPFYLDKWETETLIIAMHQLPRKHRRAPLLLRRLQHFYTQTDHHDRAYVAQNPKEKDGP